MAAPLFACDDPAEACFVPPRFRGVLVTNGVDLQGPTLTGLEPGAIVENGSNLNGIELQGVQMQGIEWQGVHLVNGAALEGLDVDGAHVVDSDGRRIDLPVGAELPALLTDGSVIALRVETLRHDAGLTYYGLSREGRLLCGEGKDGLFVAGTWDASGDRHVHDAFGVTYACTTGVITKCVTWGYDPSAVGPELHQACTRMARADYCGDGTPHTVDGTMIDVFDDLGVVGPDDGADGFEFEAAWGPDGASCVSRPRYDERVVGVGDVLPSCWDALPRCETLAEAQRIADAEPHLANASVPQPLLLCEPR